jgi:hypothetical protein
MVPPSRRLPHRSSDKPVRSASKTRIFGGHRRSTAIPDSAPVVPPCASPAACRRCEIGRTNPRRCRGASGNAPRRPGSAARSRLRGAPARNEANVRHTAQQKATRRHMDGGEPAERTHGAAPGGSEMFPDVPECSTMRVARRMPAPNEANVVAGGLARCRPKGLGMNGLRRSVSRRVQCPPRMPMPRMTRSMMNRRTIDASRMSIQRLFCSARRS